MVPKYESLDKNKNCDLSEKLIKIEEYVMFS